MGKKSFNKPLKPKFELDRKKMRKLKRLEKKKNKMLDYHSNLNNKHDNDPNISQTPYIKNHVNADRFISTRNDQSLSLEKQEQKIFGGATKSTQLSKNEAEMANKKEDKIIKDMEKRLGIRKKKQVSTKKDAFSTAEECLNDLENCEEFEKFEDLGNVSSDDDGNPKNFEDLSNHEDSTGYKNIEDSNDFDCSEDFEESFVESDSEGSENLRNIDNANDGENDQAATNKEMISKSPPPANLKDTYVPPHLRSLSSDEILKRKIKGLVNRVSTSNLKAILASFNELYQEHPRGAVNAALIASVQDACLIRTIMPARLCAEHMLLTSALSTLVGPEFVSPLLEDLAKKLEEEFCERHGKLLNNIVAMICYLYSLKTISCIIIFDVIRRHLETFTEHDLEVLLYIFKTVGLDIRKSDPHALKDIVACVNDKASQTNDKSSRFLWFIETLTAVKNNNVNKIPNYDKSDIVEVQKAYKLVVKQAPLNLQIGLNDLLDADSKGRWWVVGAAWTGKDSQPQVQEAPKFDSKILLLAKKNHMNTKVRKDVFCILMSSQDYEHCFERMMRLSLKNKEEREVIYVTMVCALKSKRYNQYYTDVLRKFCGTSKSYQITTQFSIWDRLKDLSSLSAQKLNNFCELLSSLLKTKTLSLAVLKVVSFAEVKEVDINFLKSLFVNLLDESEVHIIEIFGRLQPLPLDTLKNGIKVFMKHFLKAELNNTQLKNMKIALKCF